MDIKKIKFDYIRARRTGKVRNVTEFVRDDNLFDWTDNGFAYPETYELLVLKTDQYAGMSDQDSQAWTDLYTQYLLGKEPEMTIAEASEQAASELTELSFALRDRFQAIYEEGEMDD